LPGMVCVCVFKEHVLKARYQMSSLWCATSGKCHID